MHGEYLAYTHHLDVLEVYIRHQQHVVQQNDNIYFAFIIYSKII